MKKQVRKKIPLNTVFREFEAEKSAMNLSTETLKTYVAHVKAFQKYVDVKTVEDITPDAYRQFVLAMQSNGTKDTTITSYCRGVRAFCYWLMDTGYIDRFAIRLPKYQKPVKRCYTDEDLRKLLARPQRDCMEKEYLCWVFANVAISTGLRLTSILSLKASDIEGEWLYADRTKNNRGLKLYLNAEMQRILRRYILLFDISGYLFCNAQGKPYNKSTMSHMMNQYNKSREVEATGIHRFRHTYARNYYLQTHDIFALSKLLGHSSIAVTQMYLTDIGMETLTVQNVYNPQRDFASEQKKKRRGKLKR